MGFFDNAQEVLDRGVSAAKGAVSGVAVEQQAFVKGFARLCSEGSSQGWHESNGGNASYRLAPEDVASSRSFFYDNPSSWVPLGVQVANLGGEFFLVTAAGAHMRNVALYPDTGAGIVEVNAAGDACASCGVSRTAACPRASSPATQPSSRYAGRRPAARAGCCTTPIPQTWWR